MTKRTAADILAEGANTFRERNKVYGDNYKRAGGAFAALFPNGVTLKTKEDHDRFHLFSLIVVKLSRYAVSIEAGKPHRDSIHDAGVYCAMVESVDEEQANNDYRDEATTGFPVIFKMPDGLFWRFDWSDIEHKPVVSCDGPRIKVPG